MNEPNPPTQTTQPVSLATLLTPSKTVSVDYPEFGHAVGNSVQSGESTKGIVLEIVGASDYTTNGQGIINELHDNVVSGYAEGTFWNPYREEFQNGLVVFENLEIGTDTTNTFYSEYY